MKKRSEKRPFWLAFAVTAPLLLTAAGLIAVDWNGRALSFGDRAPPFKVVETDSGAELSIRLFGIEKEMDFTAMDDFFDFLCDFGCIPHK